MSAVLIGEGEAFHQGQRLPGGDALAAAGLSPVTLGPKEGLALVNGTQFSTALALAGLFDAQRCLEGSIVAAALATDAVMGSTAPLAAEIHTLRGHQGQIDVADAMRGSPFGVRDSREPPGRRPACSGSLLHPLPAAGCWRSSRPASGCCSLIADRSQCGDGQSARAARSRPDRLRRQFPWRSRSSFAADLIALAVSETGSIAQRRVALMVDPSLSFDLPPFLAKRPGLDSGFMATEITTAALMSENRHLANPCSTDTTPTSANQEDHVSMSAHAARRLGRMTRNLATIIGIEAMCGAQGIEFRAPLQTSAPLQRGDRAIAVLTFRRLARIRSWRSTSRQRRNWCETANLQRQQQVCTTSKSMAPERRWVRRGHLIGCGRDRGRDRVAGW